MNGGTNPIQLSEYYGVATGVPASGQIGIGDFYGTSSGGGGGGGNSLLNKNTQVQELIIGLVLLVYHLSL